MKTERESMSYTKSTIKKIKGEKMKTIAVPALLAMFLFFSNYNAFALNPLSSSASLEAKDDWGWRAVSGKWTFDAGKCSSIKSADNGETFLAVSNKKIQRSAVSFTFKPTQNNKVHGVGGYGPVKFIDEKNYIAVRYGAYGGIAVYILENGKKDIRNTGCLAAQKVGEQYRGEVLFNDDRIMIFYNGKIVSVIGNLPFGDKEGCLGLYVLGSCEFDDLKVEKRESKAQSSFTGKKGIVICQE